MNLKLNMKDINKILAKAHFKCNFFYDAKKQHFCRNMSMKLLEVSPSCLHISLMFSEGGQVSLYFASVVSPEFYYGVNLPGTTSVV